MGKGWWGGEGYIHTHAADELNSLTNKPPPPLRAAYVYTAPTTALPATIDAAAADDFPARVQWRVIIITTRKATSLFSRKRFLILITMTTTGFNSHIRVHVRASVCYENLIS